MEHFTLEYAFYVNEALHRTLWSTWFYKHEVYEVPGLVTALLITYDDQHSDEFEVNSQVTWEHFLRRMGRVKPDWAHFSLENMRGLAQQPHKTMLGWEGRTIYFIKGGSNPEYWTAEKAREDVLILLAGSSQLHGEVIWSEVKSVTESIPVGGKLSRKYARKYEDFVRVVINFLFIGSLGEAVAQQRTEPGNEGCEIRDLLCQNRAQAGFWRDLKDKYSCSEILFEAKNTESLTRGNLRQTYCYLKPALGLWGFVVCRAEQPGKIHAYNRTLFHNFAQARGVLILTDDDLKNMVIMKLRGLDPSDYLRDRMSDFVRSI